jgi:alkanesulfonate monooxygenase SsuD/methylene tetrahydromethanopterin reductase-like flavin-dependent oxidoreductase (luciferase family)
VRLHRREFLPLPSPEEARSYEYSPQERVVVEMNRARHFIGTPETVASMIRNIASDTDADEVMITSTVFGRMERFRCYELIASEFGLPVKQAG